MTTTTETLTIPTASLAAIDPAALDAVAGGCAACGQPGAAGAAAPAPAGGFGAQLGAQLPGLISGLMSSFMKK